MNVNMMWSHITGYIAITGVSTQLMDGHLITSSRWRHRIKPTMRRVPRNHKYRINSHSICAVAFLFCAMCRPRGQLHNSFCPGSGGYLARWLQQLSRYSLCALSSRSESFPSDQSFGEEINVFCPYSCAEIILKRIFWGLHFACFVYTTRAT